MLHNSASSSDMASTMHPLTRNACSPALDLEFTGDSFQRGASKDVANFTKSNDDEPISIAEILYLGSCLWLNCLQQICTLFACYLCWLTSKSSGGWHICALVVALVPTVSSILLNAIHVDRLAFRGVKPAVQLRTKTLTKRRSSEDKELVVVSKILRRCYSSTATIIWFITANTLMFYFWLLRAERFPVWEDDEQYMFAVYLTIVAIGQDLGLLYGVGIRRPAQKRAIAENWFVPYSIRLL